jgi:UDP-glucose 4-epimerase
LLDALKAQPDVEVIHTVARRDLASGAGNPAGEGRRGNGPRVIHTRADLRDPAARQALTGVDLLFHLGFQLWLGEGGEAEMAATNLAGTANVLAGGPRRVVLLSSAAVYGAWPDNPCPLPESAPPRPNRECAYAGQKLAVERMCAAAAPTFSLRVAAVLGPDADPVVRRVTQGYRRAVPAVTGVRQAVQFVHQDDVVAACLAAGRKLAGGDTASSELLNVAPADWLDAAGIAAVTGGRILSLPRSVLLGASCAAQQLGLTPFGPDRSVLLAGPLALDPAAAFSSLGWRASRSSAETLASMFAGPRAGEDPIPVTGFADTGARPWSAWPPWRRAGR